MYREVYISSVFTYYTPPQPLYFVRVLIESQNNFEVGISPIFPCSSCAACCTEMDEAAATSGATEVFFAWERLGVNVESFGLDLELPFFWGKTSGFAGNDEDVEVSW